LIEIAGKKKSGEGIPPGKEVGKEANRSQNHSRGFLRGKNQRLADEAKNI